MDLSPQFKLIYEDANRADANGDVEGLRRALARIADIVGEKFGDADEVFIGDLLDVCE